MPAANALIGLGANLGDRLATLDAAIDQLRLCTEIEVLRVSPWLETEPAGGPPNQPLFLNGAVWIKTQLDPAGLLARLHRIENGLGRERTAVWAPRTLDLDLLLYDDLVLNTSELQIPHRWLPFRSFVLDPAVVIAPDWVHPILQKSIFELRVLLGAIPYWFVIDGATAEFRCELAGKLAEQFQGFSISAISADDRLDGELPFRELPARELFVSSVDWTKQNASLAAGLKIQIPARDSQPSTTWEINPGSKSWPFPKARIQLCGDESEFLNTDQSSLLSPLFKTLSPLPTLNLRTNSLDAVLGQAAVLISAMTVGK